MFEEVFEHFDTNHRGHMFAQMSAHLDPRAPV